MDSAALLEGIWPLDNEGLETAVVVEHERERLEWLEPPLIGAEVVNVSSKEVEAAPVQMSCFTEIPSGQTLMTNGIESIELCNTVSIVANIAGKDLAPMYETLNELREEVAKNIEETLLDGAKIDPNEDFDVDDLLEILGELDSGDSNVTAIVAPSPPKGPVEPCRPSPVPSFGSDSGLGSTYSESSVLDLLTVTVDEKVEDAEGVDGESYDTIDYDALQSILTANGYTEDHASGEYAHFGMDSTVAYKFAQFEVKPKVVDSTRHETSSDENPSDVFGFPSVAQFHSYAQKPQGEAKEEKSGKGGRKRKVNDETAVSLKKSKKKEQNKTAAQRYRMKKKMESGSVYQEEQEEDRRNKELKTQVAALESEIKYLKDLMVEFQQQRKTLNGER